MYYLVTLSDKRNNYKPIFYKSGKGYNNDVICTSDLSEAQAYKTVEEAKISRFINGLPSQFYVDDLKLC